jgi:hypothetical protein
MAYIDNRILAIRNIIKHGWFSKTMNEKQKKSDAERPTLYDSTNTQILSMLIEICSD